ncbi:MAG TPA: HlyC/CorC family transporter [Candidatus Sulfotelmatobacter sp.]|nr:HlyC/CorC family transporter [Candidatus Sulfotelmatobacter sp.]
MLDLDIDTYLLLSVVAIILLLALAAFFSAAETALTTASRARMHHLEHEGNRRAALVNRLGRRKDRLIGALLLGNNLANILASALATSVLIRLFGAFGVAYATIAMTALVLIFAEVLPKTWAIQQPDRAALAVAPPVRWAVRLFLPAVQSVEVLVRLVFKLFGVDVSRKLDLMSADDELRGAIALHGSEGNLVKQERDMLGSILDLDLVHVADIMVHRKAMETIDADLPPAALVAAVLASPHSRLPLWRDEPDNIVGVLRTRDLLRAINAASGRLETLDIAAIAAEPWFVPETTSLREQLNAFRQRRARFALVVDEYGALMGLVTLVDILEEIVGEIRDEHDRGAGGIRPQSDGSYIVDGTVTIRDLNRQFDWSLPDEDAATIAGLVINQAKMIPNVGQTFAIGGFTFEILRRQRNQITQLQLRPPARTGVAA